MGVIRESSESHQRVVRESSDSCQRVVRVSTKSCQESRQRVVKESLKSRQRVVRELSDSRQSCQRIITLRCQINESTQLSFLDFSPALYLDMSCLNFQPTSSFGPMYSFCFSTLLLYLALFFMKFT